MTFCSYERTIFADWVAGVSEACSFNLQQPLITRSEESKLICVNFDPQVRIQLILYIYGGCDKHIKYKISL